MGAEILKSSRRMADVSKLIPVLILLCVVETHCALPKRIHRDFRYPVVESFDIYWNVPTYACQKFNINFEPELKKYGITVNSRDEFRGEKIIILYDPGMFPAMLEDTSTGKLKERNGGIPQRGNIDTHLDEFKSVVEKIVPKNFSGIGIIDFEAWRPVWRQNWNDQVIYKNMSINLEKKKNPQLNDEGIQELAKVNFEAASKVFMDDTLKLVKYLRPNAKWGYYGFPYCFNSGIGDSVDCSALAQRDNNQIQWLFSDSTAYYPSLYVNDRINANQVKSLVIGRLNEAWRMAVRVSNDNPPPVYPYVGFRYIHKYDFLAEDKMFNILDTIRKYKMGGAVIWGSSRYLKSEGNCKELYDYVQNVLGPTVQRVKGNNRKLENIKFGGYIITVPGEDTYVLPERRPFSVDFENGVFPLN